MYFPTSSALIEFLILAILEQGDSYGYEISQTIKLIAKIKESTLANTKVGCGNTTP